MGPDREKVSSGTRAAVNGSPKRIAHRVVGQIVSPTTTKDAWQNRRLMEPLNEWWPKS